jgi:hypothetical protein
MFTPDLPIHPIQPPRLGSYAGLRLREDTLYANHNGEEKKAIRKRAAEALENLQEPLSKLLEPEEAILYVAIGQAPASTLEQLTLRLYVYNVTTTALVFTNRRMLQFLLKPKSFVSRARWPWRRCLRSVSWGDVVETKVTAGWLDRRIALKYRDGKKETYLGLRRDDAKKIKLLLEVLLPASTGEATAAQGIVSLCPECRAMLTPGVYQCGQCRLAFKDETTMVRRALLIPGGGFFYTGQLLLGVSYFIVEAILLAVIVIWGLAALGIVKLPAEPGETPATPGAALFVSVFILLILALEKLVTIHHCRRFIRQFIPAA